jgi:hypothetical protein
MQWPHGAGPDARLRIWMRRLSTDRRTGGAPRAIAAVIQDLARHGHAYPGLDYLARETGYHRATVIRAIDRLVRVGYLGRGVGGGRRRGSRRDPETGRHHGQPARYWPMLEGDVVLEASRPHAEAEARRQASRVIADTVARMRPYPDAPGTDTVALASDTVALASRDPAYTVAPVRPDPNLDPNHGSHARVRARGVRHHGR